MTTCNLFPQGHCVTLVLVIQWPLFSAEDDVKGIAPTLLVLSGLSAAGTSTLAHDCYTDLRNTLGELCCNNRDCRPVRPGEIDWKDGTWYYQGQPVDSRRVMETTACDHPFVCLPGQATDVPRCLGIPWGT